MAQISKGDTFTDGEQVTGARLNQLVDSATLLAGVITDQTNITVNTVASGDSILLYDLSATALREANVSDVLGSNLPIIASAITTSSVTAGANSDIVLTPNDGTIVTGQAYTSGDGLTVTVTSTAHLLTVGQVILVTAAGTGYNGTFRVATVTVNSFTYVMTTAAIAGSGTLSYTKKALVKNPANESVAGNLYVDGTAVVATSSVTGNQTVAGNQTVSGNSTVTGGLVVTGAITNSGIQVPIKVAVLTKELTSGGTFALTAGAWNSLPYNTIQETSTFVTNASSFTGVLSSAGTGTITLPVGTYVIDAEVGLQSGGGATILTTRIYDATAATVVKYGTTTQCANYAHGMSVISTTLTLASPSNINIQYYVGVSAIPQNPSGHAMEVPFIAKITKIA